MEKQKTKMKSEAGTSRVSSSATLSSTSSPRTRVHWSSPPTARGAATSSTLKPIGSLASSPTTTSVSLNSRQTSMVSLRTATSHGSSSTTTANSSAKIKANTSESNATAITTTTSSGSPASSSSTGGSAENESSSSTYLSAMPDSSSTACMASVLRNYVVHTSATSVSPMSTTTVGSMSNRHGSTASAISAGSAVQGWTTMTWHSSTTALDEPLLTVATVNVRSPSGTRNPAFIQFPPTSLQHQHREGQREFIPWEDTDDEVEPNAAWAHLAPLTAATGDCEPPADEDLSANPVVGKCHSAPCTSGYGPDRTPPLLRIMDNASTLSLMQRSPQVPALRRLSNTPPSASRGLPQPPGLPVAINATRQTGEPNAWPPRLPRSAFPPVASAVYRRSAPPSVAMGSEPRGPSLPIPMDAQRFFPHPAPQHRSYSASAGDRRTTTNRSRYSDTASYRSARPVVGPSDHLKGCIKPWPLLEAPPTLPGIKFQAPRPFNMAPPTWSPNFMTQSSSDEREMSVCKHLSRRSSSQPKSYPETKGVLSSRRVFTNIKFLSNKRDASHDAVFPDNSGRRILSRSPARSLPPFTRAPSTARKISDDLPPSKLMKIMDSHSPGLSVPNNYNGTFYGRTFVGSPAWGGRVVQPSPSARRSSEASRAPRVFRRSTSVFPSPSHPHSAPPFARRSSQTRFDDQQSPFGSPEDTRPEPWKGLREVNESAEPFPYNNIFGIVPPNLRWDVPEERSEELFYKKERPSEKEPFDFTPGEIRAMHQKEHHEHSIEKSCYIFRYPFNHNEMKNNRTESNPLWSMKREPEKSYPFYFSADGMDYMKQQPFVSPKEANYVRPWKRHRGRSEELPPKQQFPRIKLPYSPTRQGTRTSHQEILTHFDPENYDEPNPASPFGTEHMVYREPIDPELFDLPPDQLCLGHVKRPVQYEDDNSFRNMTDENPSARYAPQDLRMRTCKQKREWGVEASITIGERSSDQLSPAAAMKPMKALPRDNSPCSPCPWPERCNIALSFSFDKFGHAERNSLAQPCIEPPPEEMSPDPWVAPLNQAMVDSFAFAKPGKIQSPFPPLPTSAIPRRKDSNLNSWRQPFAFSPRPPRDMPPQEIQLWQCQLNNEAFPFVPFSPDSFKADLFDSGACKDVTRREVFGEGPHEFESGGDLVSLDESSLLQKNTDELSLIEREEKELDPPHSECWTDEMCVTGSRFGTDRSSENLITDRSPDYRQLISSSTEEQVEEVNSTSNIIYSELDNTLLFNEGSLKDGQETDKEPLVTILREKFQDDTKRRNSWDESDEYQNLPQYSPSQRRHNKEPFGSFRLGQQRVLNQLDNIEMWDEDIKNKSLQIFEEFSSSQQQQQQHETVANSLIGARKRLLYAQDLLSQRKYSPPNSIKSLVGSKFGASERYSEIPNNDHNEFEPDPEISPESTVFEPSIRNLQTNVKKSYQNVISRIPSADTRGKQLTMPQQIRTPMAPREDKNPFHRHILQRSLNFQEFSQQRMMEQTPALHQTPNALQHIVPFVPSSLKMRLSSEEESFTSERILKDNRHDQYNGMDQNMYIENSEFNNEEINVPTLPGSGLHSLPEHKLHPKDSPGEEMNLQRTVCASDSVSSISFHQSLCPASPGMDPKVINVNHQQRYLPIRRSLKFCKHPCCHHTSLSQNIFEEENHIPDTLNTSQQESVIKVIEPSDLGSHMTDRKTSESFVTEEVFSEHKKSRNQSISSQNGDKAVYWFNQTPSFQQATEQHSTKDNVDYRHSRGSHKSTESRRNGIENNDSRKEKKAKELKMDHSDNSTLRHNKSHLQRRKDFNKPWKVSQRSEERSDPPKKLPWGDLPDAERMNSREKVSKDAPSNNKAAWKPRTFRRRPWPRPPPGEGPLPSERVLGGPRKPAAPRWKPNRLLAAKETMRKNFAEFSSRDTAPNASSLSPHSAYGRNQSHKTNALSSKPDKRRATSGKTISELYRSAPWVESQISLGNTPETSEPITLPSFTSKKEQPTYNIVAAAVTTAVAIQASKDSKLTEGSATDAEGKSNLGGARENDVAAVCNKDTDPSVLPSSPPKNVLLPPKARGSVHSGESVASYMSAHSQLGVQDPGDSNTSAPGSTRTLLPDDNSDANRKIDSLGIASDASFWNKNNTSSEKDEKCIVCCVVKRGAPKKTS